jgi:hypothetical protein
MTIDLNNTSLIIAIVAGIIGITESILAIIVIWMKKRHDKNDKDQPPPPDNTVPPKERKIVIKQEIEIKTRKTIIITF